jgi:hypothetical protein
LLPLRGVPPVVVKHVDPGNAACTRKPLAGGVVVAVGDEAGVSFSQNRGVDIGWGALMSGAGGAQLTKLNRMSSKK